MKSMKHNNYMGLCNFLKQFFDFLSNLFNTKLLKELFHVMHVNINV